MNNQLIKQKRRLQRKDFLITISLTLSFSQQMNGFLVYYKKKMIKSKKKKKRKQRFCLSLTIRCKTFVSCFDLSSIFLQKGKKSVAQHEHY